MRKLTASICGSHLSDNDNVLRENLSFIGFFEGKKGKPEQEYAYDDRPLPIGCAAHLTVDWAQTSRGHGFKSTALGRGLWSAVGEYANK